ncbi:MAG: hypothetical protein WC547_01815 [Candidatus Omnitrophota bacterium]
MILLIPTAVLLAISFFVLVTVTKIEAKSLKIFGWAVCVFLWVVAAFILATTVTTLAPVSYHAYDSMGICDFKDKNYRNWRRNPHQQWQINPHSRNMLNDPHRSIMNEYDNPMENMMGSGDSTENMMDQDLPEKK